MTPASATGHACLQPARAPLSIGRERLAGRSGESDGLYGLAQRWPAWLRLLVIGGLGVAVWATVILTAWPLIS